MGKHGDRGGSMTEFSATTIDLPDIAATDRLGRWLGQHLPCPTVLLLNGDLGSGKTSLVKGIGRGLGIRDEIDSPTFTLVNEYVEGRSPLYHMDLYRLNAADVASLYLAHYWDGIEYPPGIVAIEWAERLGTLPPDALLVTFVPAIAGRRVTLSPTTPVHAALLETLTPHALLADEV